MTNQLTTAQVEEFLNQHKDPADARRFLQKAGFIDENGELTAPYRQDLLAEPAPVAYGEVAELVAWLGVISEQFRLADLNDEAAQTDRAADLLKQLANRPAVQSREPASVTTEPSDEELYDYWISTSPEFGCADPVGFARAVLARWGPAVPSDVGLLASNEVKDNPWKDALLDALVCNFLLNEENASDPRKALRDLLAWEAELARDPLINPPPQPAIVQQPSEQELKTFACEWWRTFGFVKDKATCAWVLDQVAPEHFADYARDVLARWNNATAQPIPVSERLPKAGDCTAQGWCWVLYQNFATWTLGPPLGQDGKHTGYTHWLPFNALPLP